MQCYMDVSISTRKTNNVRYTYLLCIVDIDVDLINSEMLVDSGVENARLNVRRENSSWWHNLVVVSRNIRLLASYSLGLPFFDFDLAGFIPKTTKNLSDFAWALSVYRSGHMLFRWRIWNELLLLLLFFQLYAPNTLCRAMWSLFLITIFHK